jgi:carboxymethylenebutenolidase
VVVIQEWWGLTDHVADVTNRLAREGFVALAPDLYGGSTTHDPQEAARLMRELPVDRAARDLAGAVDYLLEHESVTGRAVGVVGFCMGGKFALVLAAQQGERVGDVVRQLRAAIETQSGIEPGIHFYPAGHAFFNDQNPASYHRDSALQAWTRTLDFLRSNLGS